MIPVAGGLQPRAAVALHDRRRARGRVPLCGAGPRMTTRRSTSPPSTSRSSWRSGGPTAPRTRRPRRSRAALHGAIPVDRRPGLTDADRVPLEDADQRERQDARRSRTSCPSSTTTRSCGWAGAGRARAVHAPCSSTTPTSIRACATRIELTAGLIGAQAPRDVRVRVARRRRAVERVLSLVLLGDLVSLYLAVLRGVDPTPVDVIETLKSAPRQALGRVLSDKDGRSAADSCGMRARRRSAMSQAVATQRRLREERDRAQRYLNAAGTLVVVLDDAGRVELINRQGCELLGFEEDELLGRDWFGTVVPAARPPRRPPRVHAPRVRRRAGRLEPARRSCETRGGETRTIAWRNAVAARPQTAASPRSLRSGEDVTERSRAEAQVAFLAYHDRLTGLANRTLLEEQVRRDLARARRTGGSLALLYFDLDNFKLVNDSLGHAAPATRCCAEAAHRVSELTRDRRRAGAPGRRRVPAPARLAATTGTAPRRADRRRAHRRRARRALRDLRRALPRRRVDRHRALPGARGRRRHALQARRPRDVPGQAPRRRHGRVLRARRRPTPASGCRSRSGCGARSARASCACTCSRSSTSRTPHRRRRGARALGGPRARRSSRRRCSSASRRRRDSSTAIGDWVLEALCAQRSRWAASRASRRC